MLPGTLDLMILRTLEAMGPLHGYRLARRIEDISAGDILLNQGTLYPALLKLEQSGWIAPAWGESETGRRVKVYRLTAAGRRQLRAEEADWKKTASVVARFFKLGGRP